MVKSILIFLTAVLIPTIYFIRMLSFDIQLQLLKQIYPEQLKDFKLWQNISSGKSIWSFIGDRPLLHWERLSYSISYFLFNKYDASKFDIATLMRHERLIKVSKVEIAMEILLISSFVLSFLIS